MPLKQRLERIEEKVKHHPHLSGAQWWAQVLNEQHEGAHEAAIHAAYFLAANDLIAKPAPTTWTRLEECWSSDSKEWSNGKLFLLWAYTQLVRGEEDVFEGDFEEDADKANLCILAILFWRLFKEAPAPTSTPAATESDRERHNRLMKCFVRPLLECAYPEVAEVSSLGLAPWLDEAPSHDEGGEYLHSLRTFIEPYLREEEPVVQVQ